MKRILITFFALFPLVAGFLWAADPVKEPVYIYLYARITDHVNLKITEDQIHRLLPALEKLRKAHPEANVSATVLFSGAVSEALAKQNAQTHIVDFVRDFIRRGIIEPGYDGTDEPTYQTRPLLDFSKANSSEDRWQLRQAAYKRLLTENRDALTGESKPGVAGGLKAMEDVFGKPVCLTGLALPVNELEGGRGPAPTRARLPENEEVPERPEGGPITLKVEFGGDTEAVHLLSQKNTRAIMFGLPDANPSHLPGFRDGVAEFSNLMSPAADTAPEVFWQDNVLRTSEASGRTIRLIHARDGVEAIKKMMDKADRSKVHVLHVEVASEEDYLTVAFIKSSSFPPQKYAYDHPNSPLLPAESLLPTADVDSSYAKEEAVLHWLTGEFFPADPGSRFVSSTGLKQMAGSSTGFSISTKGLQAAAQRFLDSAGNNTYLPSIFQADGHYLSFADIFQVLTDELAAFHQTGKLPATATVTEVYGPVRVYTGHGPNEGELTVASLTKVCSEIQADLHNLNPAPIPKNSVPSFVTVEAIKMNPAQFLRLMARAVVNPTPEAKLNVRMTYMLTAPGELYPKWRPLMDDGFAWTLKPAQLRTP
ncbi:MAG: hypothetical protein M3Y72_12830 [Acidobacteriota bacterium]|nr:hypothetical protein [Acidobacteriota bacterium]